MGKVFSTLFVKKFTKPLREFNIESRVEKVILKDKPVPAPRHPSALEKEVSSSGGHQDNESPELLNRLKEVYVTSADTKKAFPDRPLPSSRIQVDEPRYGYYEPKRIPYGKTTLRNALQFIAKNQESPSEWTAKRIADEHKLDEARVEKVLRYFYTFTMVIPSSIKRMEQTVSKQEETLIGPSPVVKLPAPIDPDDK